MHDDPHLTALAALGTGETWHYGTTLLEHLHGTREILKRWGARDALCLAGLFHSIYGTAYFETKTADLARRDEIRRLIGEEAEALVYLFCVTQRTEFFDRDPGAPAVTLHDQATGETVDVPPSVLRDLVEIHVANDVEILPHVLGKLETERIAAVLDRCLRNRAWLSPAASAEVERLRASLAV
jgi:hypothetical protein